MRLPHLGSVPILTRDGRQMYFSSTPAGGLGGNDIYQSSRHYKHDDFAWTSAINIGGSVNTAANEASPAVFEDDTMGLLTLYFDSNRPGGPGPFADDPVAHNGNDIYSSILLYDGTFTPATLVGELSTASADRQPAIRRDGLEIFFASDRLGGLGALDLWVSTREKPWDPWSTPANVGVTVNSVAPDAGPALSFDGSALYFQSSRVGAVAFDLYVTTRDELKRPGREHDQE